jgi:hypothetical protein
VPKSWGQNIIHLVTSLMPSWKRAHHIHDKASLLEFRPLKKGISGELEVAKISTYGMIRGSHPLHLERLYPPVVMLFFPKFLSWSILHQGLGMRSYSVFASIVLMLIVSSRFHLLWGWWRISSPGISRKQVFSLFVRPITRNGTTGMEESSYAQTAKLLLERTLFGANCGLSKPLLRWRSLHGDYFMGLFRVIVSLPVDT